ncbi:hypothetical protein [uncultured Chryseobacterium sp.]|uniref:hypothetical protein n=1 Tax=uncultured Chryseobacterium sp. TaxID=259322 RepID=UPI00345B7ACD
MKNRMWNIVQKIMRINAVFMGILSAMRTEISHKNFVAVFTFVSFHQSKIGICFADCMILILNLIKIKDLCSNEKNSAPLRLAFLHRRPNFRICKKRR